MNKLYTVKKTSFDDLADAIRGKLRTTSVFTPLQMPSAIRNIPAGSSIYVNMVDLSQYKSSTITSFINADTELILTDGFAYCSSLSQVNIPNCSYIGTNAFGNVFSLERIYLPDTQQYHFSIVGGLTDFYAPNCQSIGASAFYNDFYYYATLDDVVELRDASSWNFENCIEIKSNAFHDCILKNLAFPKCETIGTNAFAGGFFNDSEMPYLPQCKNIGSYAFAHCERIEHLNFSNCINIETYAFQSCYGLKTISLPECKSIGMSAFISCSALISFYLPKCENIEWYAFDDISFSGQPIYLDLPECQEIGEHAFGSATISEVNLPKLETFYNFMRPDNFLGSSLDLPECTYAINLCSFPNLTRLSIPKLAGYYYAFYNFPLLETISFVKISSFTNTSGSYFLRSCPRLKSVYLGYNSVVRLSSQFGSILFGNHSAKILVPSSLYAGYMASTYWRSYSSRILSY